MPPLPSRLLTRYTPMSVRGWLVAVVAVAMIPAFALSFRLINSNNKAQEAVLSTLAVFAAKSKAEAVDRQISGMINSMRVLAASHSLRSNDWQSFHAEATSGLERSRSFLIVAKDERQQVLSTSREYGELLSPMHENNLYRAALGSGEIQISGAVKSSVTGQQVFVIAMPLTPPQGEARLLIAGQRLQLLAEDFARDRIDGGWEAALVDREGVVMASTAQGDEPGQKFFLPMAASEFGRVERFEVSGQTLDVVSQRSEVTGWSVKIWADAAVVRRPIYRIYRNLMLGGLAMAAAAALAAYLLGRQISASVRHLAVDANRLGRGEDVSDRKTPVTELTAVSHALAEAAQRRRSSENEIRFLLREVAHRSKNQLMVISSLAKQSAEGADTVEEFSENFQQRIHGLSRSTDLLLAGSSAGVDLGDLLRAQVEPFKPEYVASLNIEGPPLRLEAQAAQMFGLVLHELATNAAKHGAFAAPDGKVEVNWSISEDRLHLNWREVSVTPIVAPTKRGFGTRLLLRTVNSALNGEVKTIYHPDGLEVDLSAPIAGVRQEAGA